MTALRDDRQPGRARGSDAAQQAVIERLASRFPELSRPDRERGARRVRGFPQSKQ